MSRTSPVLFRSQYERKIREWLEAQRIPFKYEPQALDIVVAEGPSAYCDSCGSRDILRKTEYTPDFYFPKTGVWMEAKGKFDARARKIALAMQKQWPHMDYRILLQRDNWMTSKKVRRYTDWLEAHQIPYAVGAYPPLAWVLPPPIPGGTSGRSSGASLRVAVSTARGKPRRKS